MKKRTRLLAFILAMVLLLGMFSGCSAPKTDENLILTKGEFFAYFVYENAMTSEQYSSEDILNCTDGSVEADIITEWGYLPEELAKKDLKKPVQKEIVVMVCANATFELKKGNVSDIKDADLLEDPQLIADAYASGFFELDNGYFDGAQEMSFAACEEIMNNANTYIANFHFDANTEVTSLAEGVKEQDTTNYHDGDILVEFIGESVEETAAEVDTQGKVTLLGTATTEHGVDNGGVIYTTKGKNKTKTFTILVHRDVFATSLGNPEIGDTVVLKQYQLAGSDQLPDGTSELMGKLVDKKYNGYNIVCTLECPNFEEAVQKTQQVLKNRRRTTLEPMNAYERHVIHAALQDMDNVTTHSTGTEPNRRVVIEFVR